MGYLGEVHALQAADGLIEYFTDDQIWTAYGGFGAPPIEYQTRQGYKQHGATADGYQLVPRSVIIELRIKGECCRQNYWESRARIINLCRVNRGGPLALILTRPNGERRAIKVRGNPGPVFEPRPDDNTWGFSESIELLAFDPVWYNPDAETVVMTEMESEGIIFPVTFPVTFGYSGAYSTGAFVYDGSWDSYPVIEIDGPYTRAQIVSEATGAYITLFIPIAGGEKRIIDLTPGAQSITNELGDNRFSDLGPDSDLAGVRFLARGLDSVSQQLIVILQGSSPGLSGATVRFSERYYAL